MEHNEQKKYHDQIEEVLALMRPLIQMDGGDVEFVQFDEPSGLVLVRLKGACENCSLSQVTLKMGIEEEMKKKLPFVTSVEMVG